MGLRAGVGRIDITPPLGTLLMGYSVPDRTAETVRDPLHATALVLESEDEIAAVLSLTVGIVDDPEVARIRVGVQARTGIPSEKVLVSAIQTHSAPCTQKVWGWTDKDVRYIDLMVSRGIEAVEQAHAKLKPVRIGISTTRSEVGINRRQIREDHTVALGQNPWAPYDPEMTVLRFQGEDGPLASVAHYGAHPTVFSARSRCVSRDWPGIMLDRLEELSGAPAFFLNGAVGDVGPRLVKGGTVGDGEMALLEVGGRAAADAVRAYSAIKEFRNATLAAITGEFLLPYQPLPSLEEARRKLAAAEPSKDQPGMSMAEYKHWQAVILSHQNQPLTGKTYQQTIIRLGPVSLVPFPGEPFAETVLRLRHYSPAPYTLCLSTSCGNNGYFPTRESLHRGGYETRVGWALGAYMMAENIDDVLITENLGLLRRLYADVRS